MAKLKTGIMGATGYAGNELIRILLNHPNAEITSLASRTDSPKDAGEIFPEFRNRVRLTVSNLQAEEMAKSIDLVFLALPHKVSMEVAPYFLKAKKKVVDLSADYRLKDEHIYARWYGVEHKDVRNISRSVYGLPEIYRDKIKKSDFIANPGCYPTSVILGAAPLFKEGIAGPELIADSKSGVSGAGRNLSRAFLYAEVNESVKPYKVNQHQHQPEMEQEFTQLYGKKVSVIFTPHLIPMTRGILSTLYIRLKETASDKKIRELYKSFYANSPFVRILPEGEFPQTKDVSHTNYCDINFKVVEEANLVIVTSAIDNMVKGASGQAVQNMNLMSGWDETSGLK